MAEITRRETHLQLRTNRDSSTIRLRWLGLVDLLRRGRIGLESAAIPTVKVPLPLNSPCVTLEALMLAEEAVSNSTEALDQAKLHVEKR